MKKQFISLLICAAVVAPIAAQAEGAYIGVDVGRSDQKFAVSGGSYTNKETSAKIYAGAAITPYIGVEGGYANFGNLSEADDGVSLHVKPSAYYLALTGTVRIDPQFSLFAKAGVAYSSTNYDATVYTLSVRDKVNKSTAMFGIGASYTLGKNWIAVVEYENFGKIVDENGIDLKMSTASIGVRYAF